MANNNIGITVGEVKEALRKVLPTLPHKMGVMAVEFSMDRFKNANWVDARTESWRKRQGSEKGNKRALLVKTGALKRSIKITHEDYTGATIGTNIPYAKVHNEGYNGVVQVPAHTRTIDVTAIGKKKKKQVTQVQVKAHTRQMRMPKRQFIGASQALTNNLTRMVSNEILKALKK